MGKKAFKNKVYLSSPYMHEDTLKYVVEAYETNWISTTGENIDSIEKLSCEMFGSKYAVALSSGTAAIHLAAKLAGVKEGDTVFCSDVTFAASVNPVVYERGKPVLIDSEYDTWNMDPKALEKAFELFPDTKVIIIVNLYGVPARYDEICAIAEKHGAVIIEDAAESMGALYNGKQTGSFGDYGVLSFNGNKIITGSSGGMLLADNKETAAKARKWSTQSRDNALWYQHTEIGYNYRMSNIVAGIIRSQFPYINEHVERKKQIFERYKEGLKDLPVTMNPYDEETMTPNFWLSCILIDEDAMCEQRRDETTSTYKPEKGKSCPTEILTRLLDNNAEGRPIWKPMHMQPIYKDLPFVTCKESYSSSEFDSVGADIFQRGLCLPSDINMTAEEQDKIIEIIKSCFE